MSGESINIDDATVTMMAESDEGGTVSCLLFCIDNRAIKI